MANDSTCRVLSTRECLAYIEANGLSVYDDNPSLSINSQAGLLYTLSNGEIVLIPSNIDLEYPGIIFKDRKTFEFFRLTDYFPIGKPYERWLETNLSVVENYKKNLNLFKKTLSKYLHSDFSFDELGNFEDIFVRMQGRYWQDLKIASPEREELFYSYSLLFVDFLNSHLGYDVIWEKTYENYNPIKNIILVKGEYSVNIFSRLQRYFESSSPNAFEDFLISIRISNFNK